MSWAQQQAAKGHADAPAKVSRAGGTGDWGASPPPLCFEWGFTRTFPGNQDVAVKYKSEVIYVKFR